MERSDSVLRQKPLHQQKCQKGKEKKEEIWLSPVTKTPTPTEQSKKQRDNIKTPPKTLITQLLRTDLGRSVGVTAVTQVTTQTTPQKVRLNSRPT